MNRTLVLILMTAFLGACSSARPRFFIKDGKKIRHCVNDVMLMTHVFCCPEGKVPALVNEKWECLK